MTAADVMEAEARTWLRNHRVRQIAAIESQRKRMIDKGLADRLTSAVPNAAKMELSDWFPDPDVPGVRMRILRGT